MVAGAGDAWTWADEGVGLWMSRAMEAGGRWRAERKSPPSGEDPSLERNCDGEEPEADTERCRSPAHRLTSQPQYIIGPAHRLTTSQPL